MRNLIAIFTTIFSFQCVANSETFQGRGNDRLTACKDAKDSARTHFEYTPSLNQAIGTDIEISECDCEESSATSTYSWVCNVDASWAKSSNPVTTNSNMSSEEVESAEGRGENETDACSGAKYFAKRKVPVDATIRRYSDCSCSPLSGSTFSYVCSVDVIYEH